MGIKIVKNPMIAANYLLHWVWQGGFMRKTSENPGRPPNIPHWRFMTKQTATHESDIQKNLLFQKVGIFIDAENIELSGLKHHEGRTDYKKILGKVGDREIVRILYYKPVYKEISATFENFWKSLGGEIKRPQKNADTFLTIDAVTLAEKLDVAIILGGDKDFLPLVWYLKSRGCRVEIWSWPEATSPEVQEAADFYFPLTKDYVLPSGEESGRGGSGGGGQSRSSSSASGAGGGQSLRSSGGRQSSGAPARGEGGGRQPSGGAGRGEGGSGRSAAPRAETGSARPTSRVEGSSSTRGSSAGGSGRESGSRGTQSGSGGTKGSQGGGGNRR